MSDERIIPHDSLEILRLDWLMQGLTIVATNGVFDIIHIGHTRYLAEAAAKGDLLVVGLNSDDSTRWLKGDKRPINTALHRAEVLLALKSVDYVVIFEQNTGVSFIRELQPDIYFKGGDYGLTEIQQSEEGAVMVELGGQIWVAQGASNVSTTGIIERIKG